MKAGVIFQELFASYVMNANMNRTGKIYPEFLSSPMTMRKGICSSLLSTAAI